MCGAWHGSVIGWSWLRFQDMEGGEDNESELSAPKGHGHQSRVNNEQRCEDITNSNHVANLSQKDRKIT